MAKIVQSMVQFSAEQPIKPRIKLSFGMFASHIFKQGPVLRQELCIRSLVCEVKSGCFAATLLNQWKLDMHFERRIPWVLWVAQGLRQQYKGHLGDCQAGLLERQGGGESVDEPDSTLAPKSTKVIHHCGYSEAQQCEGT